MNEKPQLLGTLDKCLRLAMDQEVALVAALDIDSEREGVRGLSETNSDAESQSQVPKPKDERAYFFEKHMQLMKDCSELSDVVKVQLIMFEIRSSMYATYSDIPLKYHPDYRPLSFKSYEETFLFLLQAELVQYEVDLRRYDRTNVHIRQDCYNNINPRREWTNYVTKVRNLSRSDLNLIPHLFFVVLTSDDDELYAGKVTRVDGDTINFRIRYICGVSDRRYCSIPRCPERGKYSLSFVSGTLGWNRVASAIRNFGVERKRMIFNQDDDGGSIPMRKYCYRNILEKEHEVLEGRLEQRNERQLQAIERILKADFLPAPYILFGPPGTGKTATIVELIVQIYYRCRSATILVTASSNCCVDKLAYDIHRTGLVHSMCRLATAGLRVQLGEEMQKYYQFIPINISDQRVVVTTNNMAGSERMDRQFDYVIVDEAGHASEPEVVTAINRCRSDGCVVLAGDPEQLGPVVKCRQADQLGLGKSMISRLIKEVDRYKCGEDGFDGRYVTRLSESYRCDPRILELSNEMFYDGDLKCHGRTPPGLLALLRVTDPRLFFNVPFGRMNNFTGSLSKYNAAEVAVCVEIVVRLYSMGLEPDQIGIITPYKAHKDRLISSLRSRMRIESSKLDRRFSRRPTKEWMCKIDTVDGFQGEERDIIMVSLVRTPNSLGQVDKRKLQFIDDEKRLNVTLSRAKWLNIVVGHQSVMQVSQVWYRYLIQSKLMNDDEKYRNALKCARRGQNQNHDVSTLDTSKNPVVPDEIQANGKNIRKYDREELLAIGNSLIGYDEQRLNLTDQESSSSESLDAPI